MFDLLANAEIDVGRRRGGFAVGRRLSRGGASAGDRRDSSTTHLSRARLVDGNAECFTIELDESAVLGGGAGE